jgi:hypothetical protein
VSVVSGLLKRRNGGGSAHLVGWDEEARVEAMTEDQ